MTKTITCADGTVISAETDDELVRKVEVYLIETRPELAGGLSRAEILAGASRDPGGEERPS